MGGTKKNKAHFLPELGRSSGAEEDLCGSTARRYAGTPATGLAPALEPEDEVVPVDTAMGSTAAAAAATALNPLK